MADYDSGVSSVDESEMTGNDQENGVANDANKPPLNEESRRSVREGPPVMSSASVGPRKKQYAVSTRWEREVAENGPIKDYHRFFCCCARRVGNMFILLERSDGSPIFIAGPCWPFCVGVTLPLVLGVAALVSYFILFNKDSDLPQWVAYIYLPVVAAVLFALCMVSCRDPGLMERVTDEEAGEGGWYWNEQVGSYRPPGALYCRECGVLIEGYDHLCPWTGTGIGHGNMLAFKAFVVGINILCYFSIALVAFVLLNGLVNGQ